MIKLQSCALHRNKLNKSHGTEKCHKPDQHYYIINLENIMLYICESIETHPLLLRCVQIYRHRYSPTKLF